MQDQSRAITQNANLQETCNHCTKTGTSELRRQLTAAKDHIHDLEIKVEQMTTLNKDYEKQISQLTCQIAGLETTNTKTEVDLQSMKELVYNLDGQKNKLVKEIKEKDDYRSQLERDKHRLEKCINQLQDSLHKEQTNLGSLEILLAETRQETVEQHVLNQELQADIARLKTMVKELQTKLSIHAINTVDVRLHTDPSPRSVCNSNIKQKKPQESIANCAPVYEVCYCSDLMSRNKDKDDNDTYRSHKMYELDTTLHINKVKKSNSTKTTDSSKYVERNYKKSESG